MSSNKDIYLTSRETNNEQSKRKKMQNNAFAASLFKEYGNQHWQNILIRTFDPFFT